MERIQNYLKVGNIHRHPSQKVLHYRIQSTKELKIIIDHLDLYSLITQKLADYKLFKEAYNLILNKQHLRVDGLQKIVEIKASMNRGLSDELKIAFPYAIPMVRSLVKNKIIENPEWLAGFVTAEGCFFVNIQKSATHKLKKSVQLEFNVTQHSRDELLVKSLINFFSCGNAYKDKNVYRYWVTKFLDLIDKIIPLFKKYLIIGEKSKDFYDFCKIVDMMKTKKHLTKEGLERICIIKTRMNTGRENS